MTYYSTTIEIFLQKRSSRNEINSHYQKTASDRSCALIRPDRTHCLRDTLVSHRYRSRSGYDLSLSVRFRYPISAIPTAITCAASTFATSNRDLVTLDEIPKALQQAVIAIEDERFYSHHGIDIHGILRAFFKRI